MFSFLGCNMYGLGAGLLERSLNELFWLSMSMMSNRFEISSYIFFIIM